MQFVGGVSVLSEDVPGGGARGNAERFSTFVVDDVEVFAVVVAVRVLADVPVVRLWEAGEVGIGEVAGFEFWSVSAFVGIGLGCQLIEVSES